MTDAEDKALKLWPPDAKSWLIGKDPDPGKDWGQEEKGTTEDEMVGWHHRLNGYGFGWTPGFDGRGGLACCSSWGCKESDTTERLNWTELKAGQGFPGGTNGKESTCQCRRCKRLGFHPWVGKTPWSRKRQPIPVFLPGESHGQRSLAGYGPWCLKDLDTTAWLNTHKSGQGKIIQCSQMSHRFKKK